MPRVQLRTTELEDRAAVIEVLRAAFDPGDAEVEIAEKIWLSDAHLPELDLVAVIDGEIVGHVLHSAASVGSREVIALAPLAVLPAYQRLGVGTALTEEALRRADAKGHPMVVLLGHPEYYPRFGFVEAMALGLTYQDRPAPFAAFMARPLNSYDAAIRGEFRFAWEAAG
ncbi:MAG TPA: N-acetyltransferase [Acidimicrobiales bacterium]|nr:N-acetyltransferase [Acidimicrobiales bacterium]